MQILLVEDDRRLGDQLKPEIERAGYAVTWAQNVRDGKKHFEQIDPDVILLDLMLPDGSGYELLQTIRDASTTPIIVISAKSRGEDKVRALDLGADDYVTKPFWTNELTARIRAVVRRHKGVGDDVNSTSFGAVRVDMFSRQVFVDEQPISLTPTEFSLLQFFMDRPRQALRRERIIDSVFRNPDSATEALQTHISRLRKKLGVDGARIETVWGIGYRFKATDEVGA